ncbi:MAG: 30S ribosome-binding factor RbfA [Ignavibacteria bacterium]|nr:MAG: 30S ribosome-binding factor RbfA [Ignavibacteria bacterium]
MSIRTARVSQLIKQQISETLSRDIETDGFGLLTVTEVMVTPDLRIAKVYVSHFQSGKSDEDVLAFLDDKTREIRMAVGKSVRLKFTPELRFYIDQTLDKVERLDELFRQIHEDESSR